MTRILTNPRSAAVTGILLCLPLAILFGTAAFEIEPLNGIIESITSTEDGRTSAFGKLAMIVAMLLPPIALVVVAWPVLRRGADGRRTVYPINLVLSAVIFAFIAMFVGGIVVDQYPCWQGVPNCD